MKTMKKPNIKIPQLIIIIYLIFLLIGVGIIKIPIIDMLNESLVKWAMNGILVLSLIPMLNVGAGMNFGMPVGICSGLIGMCISLELRLVGWIGFGVSIVLGSIIATVFGAIYAVILNKLKGNEEIVGNFVGFAFIPIMNFFWTLAPFKNRQMLYPVGGKGLRPKINLDQYFGGILDNALNLQIGKLILPIGLLLFFVAIGLIIYLFFKTKTGFIMKAIAQNEIFVKLSGINIDKYRIYAIVFSSILAAIGICVYSQSYGFLHLYGGPLMMDFPAISSLLIGGATGNSATVFQAMIGSYLYETTFLLSVPVANELLIPEIAEIVRMIITNGIILYAFLYKGVLKKHEKI